MRTVRILHLSDIHFRWAESGSRARDIELESPHRNRVMAGPAWQANLAEIVDEDPIDLVCMTGDIADWGQAEEYELATRFCEDLLAQLELPPTRLFVVPGNHDIHRHTGERAWQAVRALDPADLGGLSEWAAGKAGVRGLDGAWRARILERQAAFWRWVDQQLGRPELLPSRSPHRSLGYRLDVGPELGLDTPMWIVGLDTTWLAGDDNDAGKLWLTKDQILQLATTDGFALDGVRVALGHHPIAELADAGDARRLLAEYVDVYLRGHQHQPLTTIAMDPDCRSVELAAGCLFEGTRDGHANGIEVLTLTLDDAGAIARCDLLFRSWSPTGNHWHDNGAIYKQARHGRLALEWRDGQIAVEHNQDSLASMEAAISQTALRKRVAAHGDVIVDRLSRRRRLPKGSKESLRLTDEIEAAARSIRRNFYRHIGEGSIVAGARLVRVISSGSYGVVWLAEQEQTEVKVAVKIFREDRLTDNQILKRFRRSTIALRRLGEPKRLAKYPYARSRVVKLIAIDDSQLAFSMDYLSGGDLSEVDRLNWTLGGKLATMRHVCDAIRYSHANGIIHRDIKPGNVLLGADGRPVLTDFDISDIKFESSMSTAIGGVGTVVFAAPEQYESADNASELSDIYSLGRLLHFLLIERSPGPLAGGEPALDNLESFPAGVVEVVRRATRTDPEKRYASVAELSRALERSLDGQAVIAARLSRLGRAVVAHWALFGLMAALSVGIVLFSVYSSIRADEAERLRVAADRAAEDEEQARKTSERLKDQLAELSEQLEDNMKRERSYIAEANRLQMLLQTEEQNLDNLAPGSSERADLEASIERHRAQLAETEAALQTIEDEQRKLSEELEALREAPSDEIDDENFGFYLNNCEQLKIGAACKSVGDFYRRAENFEDAYRYYQRSCSFGNPPGCNDQAFLLTTGRGPAADVADAMGILEHACETLEYGKSCARLAYYRRVGKKGFLERDLDEAYRLYKKACLLEDARACEALLRHFEVKLRRDPEVVGIRAVACKLGVVGACGAAGGDGSG